MILSSKNGIEYISPSYAKIFRNSAKEELFQKVEDIWNIIHPEDLYTLQTKIYQAIEKKEKQLEYTYRARYKNGHYIWRYDKTTFEYDEQGNFAKAYIVASDITVQIEAKQALEESEARFNHIFNNNPHPTHLVNANFEIVLANVKLLRIKNVKQEDIVGKKCYEIYQNRQNICDNCAVKRVFEEKTHCKSESSIAAPNGELMYFETYAYPIFDAANNIPYVVETTIDITSLRNTEQELKKQNKELEETKNFISNITASIPGMTFQYELDDNGSEKFNFVSMGIMQLMEIASEDVIKDAKNIWNLLEEKFIPEFKEKSLKSKENLNPWNFEFQIRTAKTKKLIWVEGLGIPKRIATGKTIFHGWVNDITDRKQAELALAESEKKFKNLVNNTPDGLIIFSFKNGMEYASPNFLKILGYDEKDQITQKERDLAYIVHPDERAETLEKIKKAIDSCEKQIQYTVRVKHKQGHYIWRHDKTTFEYDEQGNFVKAYIVVSDITEDIAAENELKEAINTKDRLLSIIAHDLRSPFNSILGFADLLVKEIDSYDKDTIRSYVENIYQAVNNTYKLLLNLLEWSRSQRDNIPFRPENINLNSLVQDTYLLLKQTADNKNINIETDVPKDSSCEADKEMIKTIVRNLLSNAIKYTPENGKIWISAKQNDENIEIHIRDNGIGMNEQILNTLFKLDIIKSQEGTNGERGTGFGLLLCKEFIHKHKGNIEVESEIGKGSNFIVNLPLQQLNNEK